MEPRSCRSSASFRGKAQHCQTVSASAPKTSPPVQTARWVASRKAAVAKAIIAGLIEEGEAIAHYQLSKEELKGWVSAYQRNGEVDLRVTRRTKH